MMRPTLDLENSLWAKGLNFIVGIDEVGRGSWAGPLVVGGVILPKNFKIPEGLADSKLVPPKKRKELSKIIKNQALAFSIARIESKIIDKIGLGKATHQAFREVVRKIIPNPDYCLIDAFYINHISRKKQLAVKNGDKICASIAAASIIAKVYRDKLMKRLSRLYPNYGFAKNKGYGTIYHQEAIKKYGLSELHRHSYKINFLIS